MKQKYFSNITFMLALCLFTINIGFSQTILTSYVESFEESINLDLWNPNPNLHEDGTPIFDISQGDSVLNVGVNQAHFYDGLFFNFTANENIIFDITNVPYIAIDVKIEPGATYGGVEVDSVAIGISTWGRSEDESLQKEFETSMKYAPDDGEWHTLIYEILPVCWITIPCDFEENYTEIEAVLLEGKWPDNYVYTMQMDVFRIGEAAAELISPTGVNTYSTDLDFPIHLFPNPISDELILEAEEAIEMVSVFDLQGRLLATHKFAQLERAVIDFSNYAKGLYFIVIEKSGVVMAREKVIK